MPPLPRLTGTETIRKLRRDGWSVVRVRGSHHHLRHPSKPGTVTVPVHRGQTVALGSLGTIIQQAGLTVAEFLAL